MSGTEVSRAALVLRGTGSGWSRAIMLLACTSFDSEALAEWLERHPEDERAGEAARKICDYQDQFLDAYLRAAERGRA